MICPKCQDSDTRVLDSRVTDGSRAIRRRRECMACKNRFTTFERIEATKFLIVKRDGSREAYNREKVERGIWQACQKRKVTQEQVGKLITGLEEKWASMGKEVPAKVIGEGVMGALKDLDEVAYIRFTSVYKDFEDLGTFQKELQKLTK